MQLRLGESDLHPISMKTPAVVANAIKACRERFTPYQYEDPSRFELLCFISICLQRVAQNSCYSSYLYIEPYQRKIVD